MVDENFTSIDPNTLPPEVQGMYKQMQADYTRKRQEDSNRAREAELRARELEQNLGQYQQALTEYKQTNDMWVDWSKRISEQQPAEQDDQDAFQQMEVPGMGKANVRRRPDEERTILNMQKKLDEQQDQLSRVSTALDMALQIDELRHQYKDIDPKRVIDTALELKLPNLKRARDIAYREEDLKVEVESKVAERLKEIEQQQRTKVLDGGGDTPFELFKKMPEKPPSFEQATEEILRERILGNMGSI